MEGDFCFTGVDERKVIRSRSEFDNEIQIPKAENTLCTRDRSISGPGRVGLGRHNMGWRCIFSAAPRELFTQAAPGNLFTFYTIQSTDAVLIIIITVLCDGHNS